MNTSCECIIMLFIGRKKSKTSICDTFRNTFRAIIVVTITRSHRWLGQTAHWNRRASNWTWLSNLGWAIWKIRKRFLGQLSWWPLEVDFRKMLCFRWIIIRERVQPSTDQVRWCSISVRPEDSFQNIFFIRILQPQELEPLLVPRPIAATRS